MSSVTQEPWLPETSSSVDELGAVELFLKSLDTSASAPSAVNQCWSPFTSSEPSDARDSRFWSLPVDKPGYERSLNPQCGQVKKLQSETKQDRLSTTRHHSSEVAKTLDIETQCSSLLTPSSQTSLNFNYSTDIQGSPPEGGSTGTSTSRSWASSAPSSSLLPLDSLKVVPELLVERICQEESSGQTPTLQTSHFRHHLGQQTRATSVPRKRASINLPHMIGNSRLQPPSVLPPNYFCHPPAYRQENSQHRYLQSSTLRRFPSSGYPPQAPQTSQQFFLQQNLNSRQFAFSQVATPTVCYDNVLVKQEPSEDTMDLSSHFMCQSMFMVNDPPGSKCGCDMGKTGPHFLCPSNKRPLSMEQYGELLKRGSSLLGEKEMKSFTSTPHQSIRSDKERPYTCDECGKSFLLKHHLVTHTRVHSGERPFCCGECGKTFAHKHCLVTHQRLHSGDRPFQCIECKKSFTLKHHLVTHARTHAKDRPFICEECGRSFSQKRNLVTHGKLHSGERPYQCPECGESFSQRDHLLTHSRFHGGESAFVCSDCGEAFARKFQLVDHRRQHGHSPYACTVCGKEFLQKRTLMAHTKLHEGERPFSCTHCSQAFPLMSDLIMHSRIHTSFTCKECGNTFQTQESLVMHLQHHAQRIPGPGSHIPMLHLPATNVQTTHPVKPFLCTDCGAGFAQKHGLVQHRNRKHGAKAASEVAKGAPPVAPKCAGNLVEHMKQEELILNKLHP